VKTGGVRPIIKNVMQEAAGLTFPAAGAESQTLSQTAIRSAGRIHPWTATLLWAAGLFLIAQLWIVQGYQVHGSCMEPNLVTGQRFLGSKIALLGGIQRGDVVVFRPPHKGGAFIKRVVGLPGETIEIRKSRVYVNDQPLDEPYLRRKWHDTIPARRIPAGSVFVLGDNRDNSNDSRLWGELPVENIQSKAWVRYWPLDRAALIE